MKQTIKERIQELRLEILVFSAAYHVFDISLIEDYEWDKRAKELARLQNEFPKESSEVIYAKAFEGFTGDTAAGLPYNNPRTVAKAKYLMEFCHKRR